MGAGSTVHKEAQPSLVPGEAFAGRYRLLEELGRGGMARVLRAFDQGRGRAVALKYMRPRHLTGKHRDKLVAAFEDEFRVLDQLQHPRVVRVFDCGVEHGVPFYTMELLEGRVLEQRLPLALPELCAVLRDVASCLALLHARGYLHRDITTHNVWCEQDGHAKLLDFGAMLPIGAQPGALLGTAPYIPPEALRSEPLDARADLFALGALAYRAIVGNHAFDVTAFDALPSAWRCDVPVPPSAHGAPRALSDLVMELLSLDRTARPGTASEVMERLCAAADIDTDRDLKSAQSYLVTPPLFGRDAVVARVRTALDGLSEQSGTALLIAGGSQMGHTRLLHRLSRQAPMHGATHLSVDCRFAGSSALGVPRALCREALARLPAAAVLQALPHAAALATLAPEFAPRLGLPEPADEPQPASLAVAVQALGDWLCEVAKSQALSIAVDGVEHCDGRALGLLVQLADAARQRALLLALSLHVDMEPRVPDCAERLALHTERFELDPLSLAEVNQLCAALFFGAEHRATLGTWLHRASGGAPGTCMALARHLLDTGLARYDAGRWHLPEDPQREGLPSGLREVLERRVGALSVPARRLAQALALVHDDTRPDFQPQLHLDQAEQQRVLDALGEAHATAQVEVAHAELASAGLVRAIDGRSVIAHRAMADALRAVLAPEEAGPLHTALAAVLGDRVGERLSAVRHLQLAGQDAQALELLTNGGPALRMTGFEQMRLSLAMECLDAALLYARNVGAPREVIAHLVDGLTPVLAVFDWSRARLVEEELDLQRALFASGELDSDAQQRAVRRIAFQAGSLAFVAARAHDAGRLQRMVAVLDTVSEHSAAAAQHGRVAAQALAIVQGRDLPQQSWQVGYGYFDIAEMPRLMRAAAAGVHGHAMGVWFAERGSERALATADGFEAAVPGIWQAAHMRWLAHGFRCEGAAHERWAGRAKSVAPDDVWRRRGFLMAEARLHALLGDLLALKSVVAEIEQLAESFEGWRPFRDWARGEHHLLRGALDEARTEFMRAVATAEPGAHAAFGLAHPGLCVVEARLGMHERAIRRAQDGLAACQAHGLSPLAVLDHQLALAEALSRNRQHVEATTVLEAAIDLVHDAGLGTIHAARVHEQRVGCALRRGDDSTARAALAELDSRFRDSGLPTLAARYARLQADLDQAPRSATVRIRNVAGAGRSQTRRRRRPPETESS